MKILAIDIGAGTQDIMLYDSEENLENSIKLVLPSPSRSMVEKIKKIYGNIYFDGEIMGGGKIKREITEKIENGYKIAMEKEAAKTVRDNLNQVKSIGIKIVEDGDYNLDKYNDYSKLTLKDFDLGEISKTIAQYDMNYSYDYVAVTLQDHGYNPNMGDRDFRFEKIREKLNKPIAIEEFVFTGDIPHYFTRMKTAEKRLKSTANSKYILMDSKFSSICGASYDENIKDLNSYVIMDIGNGHTMATSIENGKVQGVFEHHTSNLDEPTGVIVTDLINKLVNGTLTHEEVHSKHGHGAHILNPISDLEKVVLTGPRRGLMKNTNLDCYNAAPGGDVMMSGPVGLIKAIEYCNINEII